jgi:hypothetical protein
MVRKVTRAALAFVVLTGCLAGQLGVHGGALVRGDGSTSPEAGVRASVGAGIDGRSGVLLVGVDSLLAPGERSIYGVGPCFGAFFEQPVVLGLGASFDLSVLFARDDGVWSSGAMFSFSLFKPFMHDESKVEDSDLGVEETHVYLNGGAELGIGGVGPNDESLPGGGLLTRVGALVLLTAAQR